MNCKRLFLHLASLMAVFALNLPASAAVVESERKVPLAYDVDVVVVGGSSAAASAAIEAAKAGAKVFLLAPRPYLGDDLCGTMRLWLEDGEAPTTPLAKQMFAIDAEPEEPPSQLPTQALRFSYNADLPSANPHKDTSPPSKLADGKWGKPETESVQYDGDVTLTADLSDAKELREAWIILYDKRGSTFTPQKVSLAISEDGRRWQEIGVTNCPEPQQDLVTVKFPLKAKARYARFIVQRAPEATRVLIGELVLLGPEVIASAPKQPVAKAVRRPARPAVVKRVLEEALVDANVDFLFSCFPSDLLRDDSGNIAGVVMANRAGRQAIRAKVVIDATPRATVARMAGARFTPYPAGEHLFQRVVIGGELQSGPQLSGRNTGFSVRHTQGKGAPVDAPLYEYTLRLPMKDDSFASFAEAEQRARDLTFHPAQVEGADMLFQIPPDYLDQPLPPAKEWPGAEKIPLTAFQPSGQPRIFLLNGCAAVSRDWAGKLLRPLAFMDIGRRIGAEAARLAKSIPAAAAVRVAEGSPFKDLPDLGLYPGDIREFLSGVRPIQRGLPTVSSPARQLPVLGMYDVVVAGGGTGGAAAGIGAGRGGAKTLLIEYQYGLGGVGTLGHISRYYHGFRGGFTAEVDKGIAAIGATNFVEGKVEYWRRANRKAGTEIWFGAMVCGAVVDGNVIKGVVVATPHGRGLILAKTVIDCTGNADVAAAAGAECDYTGSADVAVQGTGLPPLGPGADYVNTDWTFADDTDVVDFWHHYILARQKFKTAYDVGQLIDTRERRRIVGEVTISPMDIVLERRWADTVNQAQSNFDTHGFTVHPFFFAMPPDREELYAHVPLRALVPKGLEGIVVTGLGVSAHRDAMPVIRMQADVQNQGYACGRAASMVAHSATYIRNVDIKELQKHLVEIGALPESVLTESDSPPYSKEKVAAAVMVLGQSAGEKGKVDGPIQDREALAVVFSQPREAIPLLETAYGRATGPAKLAYAHILALLGSQKGADTLIEKIKGTPSFDKGWNFTGMGQFGRSMSELDCYIVALGNTKDPRALDVVLEKLALLDSKTEFSHHRACAMALESLRDARAAAPLAALLAKPGMTGYATTTLAEARQHLRPSSTDTIQRNESLRELILARALYRCGDYQQVGEKILRKYAQDLRGHYARHALAVLAERR